MLTDSNVALSEKITELEVRVVEMTASDEIKKDLFRRELVTEKMSAEKELFKRKFIPLMKGLGFVQKSSCVEKTGCTRCDEIPKATCNKEFH